LSFRSVAYTAATSSLAAGNLYVGPCR
jgi:hypothetical protein